MATRRAGGRTLIDNLRKRVPKGASLPVGLEALLAAWASAPWGELGFVNLGEADATPLLDVTPTARKRVLAFASVSCGDQLALWWANDLESPRVVVIGAHGEEPLVFTDLPAFLAHLVEGKTGVHDLDEGKADPDRRSALLAVPRSSTSDANLELRQTFTDWLLTHRPKGRPIDPQVMETLRAEIVGAVHREAMAETAFQRWDPSDVYCQWRVVADLAAGSLTWSNGGLTEFPTKAALWPTIVRLLTLTRQTRGPATITVDSEGRLFPDPRTTVEPLR